MKKRISLFVYFTSLVLAALIAFMSAYCLTTSNYKAKLGAYAGENGSAATSSSVQIDTSDKLSLIVSLMEKYSYYDINEEELCQSLISGYTRVKDDPYAYYYTAEEFTTLTAENSGENQGIGVTVIEDEVNHWIKVISVVKDSPAYKAGIQPNDRIIKIINSDGITLNVADMGYETAVKNLQGVKGTYAKFTVARGDNFTETQDYSILREEFTAESVMYHVSTTEKYSKKIGVIKITGFDLTTPPQFCAAMDDLISQGCEYFVFDVRYNPGGDLASITAILSYMLNKGDTVIITKDKAGTTDTTLVDVVNYSATSGYSSCNVSASDIGKYRDAVYGKSAVLVNGSTASAAELFTCSLKDYGVSVIVGTTTYGKGCMQTILNLQYYGYTGALKLTTKLYFPPKSEGYHGVGITPDVEVELDESLKNRNIYDISDAEDNQFMAAVAAIK